MTDWMKASCQANGIDVHYLRTGGAKPPVILLHGLMLNGSCWIPLARALEQDYDVIMPDARGHGYSSAPEKGYRYDDLAADVMGLMDTLGLYNPALLGHSMGGMTAAVVASRYARRLRGLILADPTFLTLQRQYEVYESDVAALHRQVLNRSSADLLADIQVRHSHRSREVMELFAQARFQTSMHVFEVLRPPNPDYMPLVNTLDIPSLLIIGEVGSVVSPQVAEELAGLNPHMEVVQLAAAGHGVPYDQPERFSAVVQTFLRSLNA